MASNLKITWYTDRVVLRVTQATEEVVSALVLQGEALTKANIQANNQIDTGFMLNSVNGQTRKLNHYGLARAAAANLRVSLKQGRTLSAREARDRLAPRLELTPSNRGVLGAIVVSAKYAVYQELRKPFLYPALQVLVRQAKSIAESVYARVVKD